VSRGEKRDTNSFSVRRSRDSKKNNTNERHQRKHQNQRKEATKEKTSTTPPTPRFFRFFRSRERSKNVLFWIHIYTRVSCVCFYSFTSKVKRQRHLFPSFFTSCESQQRDKGVNLFAQLISVSLFCNGFFFVKNERNAKRVTTIIIIIIIIIFINENAR